MENDNREKGITGPLAGVKVLDLTRALAGPFCTMMLADLGAEVIKVEPPKGDETRLWGPPFIGKESTYFLSINRNKKSIVVDLQKQKGTEIVRCLAAKSHVFVENYRPGTANKLGISYNELKKANPGIIYCSISGFGQDGPSREKPGYDIIIFASSGVMSLTGEPDRPPVKMGVPVSDICAGMYSAYAIVTSLYRKERERDANSGTNHHNERGDGGNYIDVSMFDAQVSWLTHQASAYFATGENPKPLGSSHPSIVPYQAFRGSDGNYFVVAVGNDELWKKFCDALSLSKLKEDQRFISNPKRVENKPLLQEELSNLFCTDSAENWIRKISSAGVPCCPINKLDETFSDPQIASRKMVLESVHPSAGKIKQLGIPYHFSDYEFSIRSPPPVLGEHTEEILLDLGYSRSAIEELKNARVVG